MDLKNRKQELSAVLAQLNNANNYDDLIALAQKAATIAQELKIWEQFETALKAESEKFAAMLKEMPVQKEIVRVEVPVTVPAPVVAAVVETVAPLAAVKEEIVKEEVKVQEKIVVAPVEQKPIVRAASISEKLQTPDVSLAARLSKTAIKDLTKAVSINQKILFTKELFKGDSFAFNEALGKLNAFENKEQALTYLQNDLNSKYVFKVEADSYSQFVELIERRYA